jgi:hypothetical protein
VSGFRELIQFIHGDGNVGARCLEHLLVVAHAECIGQITADITLATRAYVSHILFGILQVDSPSSTVGVSFLLNDPLLIGLPIARGLIVANGKDGASEAGWKGQELLPIWINEGEGIAGPMRFGRLGTFFWDCRERVLSDLPDLYHVNSRRGVVWFRQVYQTEI